jgi:DnaJ-class molecular chaperone
MTYLPGAPIVSKRAAQANLRVQTSSFMDGRYHHPEGGIAKQCGECGGRGVKGLADCETCRGTGVVSA